MKAPRWLIPMQTIGVKYNFVGCISQKEAQESAYEIPPAKPGVFHMWAKPYGS